MSQIKFNVRFSDSVLAGPYFEDGIFHTYNSHTGEWTRQGKPTKLYFRKARAYPKVKVSGLESDSLLVRVTVFYGTKKSFYLHLDPQVAGVLWTKTPKEFRIFVNK